MDGTIADLYNEENWLNDIMAHDVKPFVNAKPMHLAEIIKELEWLKGKEVATVEVCTWTPKNVSDQYCTDVAVAKMHWLQAHGMWNLLSDFMAIPYGTSKLVGASVKGLNILFDDNAEVRKEFDTGHNCISFPETEILSVLKLLRKIL